MVLYPSSAEGFGFVPYEAAALGARVVLADRNVETTTLRLKRLTQLYELAMALVVEDSQWAEAQAIERHAAAEH